ncbi:unnamed protein product [Strongylus vulgaris]|uniref:Uncharacterized protein n=1 Tax=Strongylus vulgaris TaxID=40348 RepID=A0A3P7K0S9_STRVU|nr:unnamed protein product [Strongylus vulgaris]
MSPQTKPITQTRKKAAAAMIMIDTLEGFFKATYPVVKIELMMVEFGNVDVSMVTSEVNVVELNQLIDVVGVVEEESSVVELSKADVGTPPLFADGSSVGLVKIEVEFAKVVDGAELEEKSAIEVEFAKVVDGAELEEKSAVELTRLFECEESKIADACMCRRSERCSYKK